MKILKFGGSSLTNEKLPLFYKIIQRETQHEPISLVVSARGKSTEKLIELYDYAVQNKDFADLLNQFFEAQEMPDIEVDLSSERHPLALLLKTIQDLTLDDDVIRDRVLAFGEQISAKCLSAFLQNKNFKTEAVDSATLIHLENIQGELKVNRTLTQKAIQEYYKNLSQDIIPVITGFYGSDPKGRIRTLGRNGTNYSATLMAEFSDASEVQNWTDVDGVFSADPRYVKDVVPIHHLSYREANELAHFGVRVMHSKTILPLMNSHIPMRILNINQPDMEGTLIDFEGSGRGIKAVSSIEDVSLVKISGKGLNGRVGIDARIFTTLSHHNISIRIVSQASSERGIGFVIDSEFSALSESLLKAEFENELKSGDISAIEVEKEMAIIAIVGRHNYALEKAIQALRKNRVWMHLISNSISGEHISLVVSRRDVKKALQVVHSQVFGVIKTLNVFAIGKGTVGGELIDQIIETHEKVEKDRGLRIRVIGVADSQRYAIAPEGLQQNWRDKLKTSKDTNDGLIPILTQLNATGLENIVMADNSSSHEITATYPHIIKAGFDLVASNKKGNSGPQSFYNEIRNLLRQRGRMFYYETNVGAGLPVIDTLKHLRDSADQLQRVRGVFSGSLSYLFNKFSVTDSDFTDVLLEAQQLGYTEPDPREDLCGMDVARKLIILAREIGLQVEFEEVSLESLIPEAFVHAESFEDFLTNKDALNQHFGAIKNSLKADEVLRYVGDLLVEKNQLKVSLERIPASSPLGSLTGADSIFEIYTASYKDNPIVIQGAGAGASVTARGVYSDLLRIGAQL